MTNDRKRRIVLCYPVERKHIAEIQASTPHDEVVNAGQEGVAEELLEADIFCGHAKVPVPWSEVVSKGRLQWIQSSAAGMDHCLVPEVIDSEITVSSASGLFAHQVAEQTMALLLGLIRSFPTFFRAHERREFTRRPTDDLRGKTIGLVGFGGNGRRIAEVLAPWNVRILATDAFPVQRPAHVDELLPANQLDDLLKVADVVILCVPLNARTAGFFGARQFAAMKQNSYFVNVARGQVVDEAALIHTLNDGRLAGAGLDVTETEPLSPTSKLWTLPNVIITPHVGAQSADRVDVSTRFFCENLKRIDQGKPPLNLVDKHLGFPLPEHHQGLSEAQR